MVKLSDYVVRFLENKGIKDIFLLSGGGMMHLLDSVGKSKHIKYHCNMHEQASSICAEAYGQVTKKPGVCLVTTGPGGTNAVTGVAAAWTDSTPMFVLSGQVKSPDSASNKGVRQYGLQEINIVDIVRPITKYAITVNIPEEIGYHLEKAWTLAMDGRKGPVWIDIPLDVQASQIDENGLKIYKKKEETVNQEYINDCVEKVIKLIEQSKRPLFILGNGAVASNSDDKIIEIINKFQIPVISTWRAKNAIGFESDLYFGHPGTPAHRMANYVLLNCDLLISIGNRFSPGTTAYNEKGFAPNAKVVMVEIEENEIKKLSMKIDVPVVSDAKIFTDLLYEKIMISNYRTSNEWLSFCNKMKSKYPIIKEYEKWEYKEVNPYLLLSKLSDLMTSDDNFVGASSGRPCGVSHLVYKYKKGQSFYSSMGLGAMGFSLPASIGVCLAKDKSRTFVTDGDGSFQLNIQELQTISNLNLPIIIFVFNNGCYGSIYSMQQRIFHGNLTGSNPESGVVLPELNKIASAYGINYCKISNNSEIDSTLEMIMKHDGPMICDVVLPQDIEEYPRTLTKVKADGTLVSTDISDLWPFLDENEIKENLIYMRG